MPMGLSEEMVQLHCSFSLTLSNIIASLTVLSLCASPYHQYHDGSHPTETFSSRWTRTVNRIHKPYLKHVLHPLTQRSARNPRKTVALTIFLAVALLLVGFATNFNVETDGDLLWTPTGVRTVKNRDWILQDSGYPLLPRSFGLFVHANGANVLESETAVQGMFEALDAVRNLKGYAEACEGAPYVSPFTSKQTCEINGLVKFWNNSAAIFAADSNVIDTLSMKEYPDGTPVSDSDIFGYAVRDETGKLVSTQSFILSIDFPETETAEEFETDALDAVLDLADLWDKKGPLRLEVIAERSIDDEISAAIVADIPLVPIVFTIMGIFTALIFSRRDPVHSRAFLGFVAVVSVLLSIMSGYGLMFICGINVSWNVARAAIICCFLLIACSFIFFGNSLHP